MNQTKTEVHIWRGLPQAIFVRMRIIPATAPALKFKPGFTSANDGKFGESK